MINKKGQGTTEYLIILAVIIVIALIVAAIMGWFPGAATQITQSQSKAYWKGTSPIQIVSWKITDSNAILELKNVSTRKISVTGISLGGTDMNMDNLNLAGGASGTVFDKSDHDFCSNNDPYQLDVVITYTVNNGISGKKLIGKKPLVGICES